MIWYNHFKNGRRKTLKIHSSLKEKEHWQHGQINFPRTLNKLKACKSLRSVYSRKMVDSHKHRHLCSGCLQYSHPFSPALEQTWKPMALQLWQLWNQQPNIHWRAGQVWNSPKRPFPGISLFHWSGDCMKSSFSWIDFRNRHFQE